MSGAICGAAAYTLGPVAGLVREWHPHTNLKLFTDRDNAALTRDEHYSLEVLFRDGARIEVSHNPQFERLITPFELRPSVVIQSAATISTSSGWPTPPIAASCSARR